MRIINLHRKSTYLLLQYLSLLICCNYVINIQAQKSPDEQNDKPVSGSGICETCPDKSAYEAIKSLHRQLDDDADGSVDIDESVEFLREELKYDKGYERRQEAFHKNNDKRVSVDELWDTWMKSEVQNWTIENTIEWLVSVVELPQYSELFLRKEINGSFLPSLTNSQYLSSKLGIKDPINKQRLSLKAMDAVLFGPPKDYRNTWKDKVLISLLLVALSGCWLAYRQNQRSQSHLQKMMNDMESLQKAECNLMDLQKKLEQAEEEQKNAISEKRSLEQRLKEEKERIKDAAPGSIEEEVNQLRSQTAVLREELERAELELQNKCWIAPPALKHWLQLTYEIESKSYNAKKNAAESQLASARDACDKLKRKRSSLIGAFVSTHGRSIDDVEQTILQAKQALNDVTSDLQERTQRWRQIEGLCGCIITTNPGKSYLEYILRGISGPDGIMGSLGVMGGSQDDLDEEMSIYSPSAVQKLVSASARMLTPSIGCNMSYYIPSVSVTRSQRKLLQTRDSGSTLGSDFNGSIIRSSYTSSNLMKPLDPMLPLSKSCSNVGTLVPTTYTDPNLVISDSLVKSNHLRDSEVPGHEDNKKMFYTGDDGNCDEQNVSPVPPKRRNPVLKSVNSQENSSSAPSTLNGHRQLASQAPEVSSLKNIKLKSIDSRDNLFNNVKFTANSAMDDDSTDSSINVEDEFRKGKAKKLFASFGRKKKNKNP